MKNISLLNFFTAVATAGTKVPLLAVTDKSRVVVGPAAVLIHARKNVTTDNTGNIYFGDRLARSEVLEPGDRIGIDVLGGEQLDLSEVFIDAATSADAVAVMVKKS